MSKKGQVKKVREITNTKLIFNKRLSVSEVVFGDVIFKIQALPSLLAATVVANATDETGKISQSEIMAGYLRYGVVGIENLYDEEGNLATLPITVETIMGKKYNAVDIDFFNGLNNIEAITTLFTNIINITHLTEEEKNKLDFTTPSQE